VKGPTATTSATSPISDEDDLLRAATTVFARAVDSPVAAIPAAVLMRASAIAVIPAASRDGDRYHGRGVLSARGAWPDFWTPPAVIGFEGTVPLELEIDTMDVIVIAQTRVGLDSLVEDDFVMPVGRAIVAGALGHNAPVRINADLLGYMHFDGYLAGLTIENWSVRGMRESNMVLYGTPYSTDDVLRGRGFFRLPPAARMWRDAIAGYFRGMS
jgi:lipid-binding SYLF domain-containing protein